MIRLPPYTKNFTLPGHIGAEYIEYVLRHKNGAKPQCEPLMLGDPALDDLTFADPELELYDHLVAPQKTLNPVSDNEASDGEENT